MRDDSLPRKAKQCGQVIQDMCLAPCVGPD